MTTKAQAAQIREAGARWARRYCVFADRRGSGLPPCNGCKHSRRFMDCHGHPIGYREMEVSRIREAMCLMNEGIELERVE